MQILKASPGCVYTDGENYGPTVALADGADKKAWKEISIEMAEKQQAEKAAAEMAAEAVQTLSETGEEPTQAPVPTKAKKAIQKPVMTADGHLMLAVGGVESDE